MEKYAKLAIYLYFCICILQKLSTLRYEASKEKHHVSSTWRFSRGYVKGDYLTSCPWTV